MANILFSNFYGEEKNKHFKSLDFSFYRLEEGREGCLIIRVIKYREEVMI